MPNGNGVITVRTARSHYPAIGDLLSVLQSAHDEIVVKEGGVLPKGVARFTARRSGGVTISYRLVKDGVLTLVPEGKQVRKVVRSLKPSHVVEIQTTAAARRLTRKGASRVIRAATVVIYRTAATAS